jgi:hypothetical protein
VDHAVSTVPRLSAGNCWRWYACPTSKSLRVCSKNSRATGMNDAVFMPVTPFGLGSFLVLPAVACARRLYGPFSQEESGWSMPDRSTARRLSGPKRVSGRSATTRPVLQLFLYLERVAQAGSPKNGRNKSSERSHSPETILCEKPRIPLFPALHPARGFTFARNFTQGRWLIPLRSVDACLTRLNTYLSCEFSVDNNSRCPRIKPVSKAIFMWMTPIMLPLRPRPGAMAPDTRIWCRRYGIASIVIEIFKHGWQNEQIS